MSYAPDKDIKELYHNFVSLMSSKAAVMVLSLVSVAATAYFLGAGRYGTLSLVIGLVQFSFVPASGWTSNSVVRFGRDEFIREGSIKKTFWSRTLLVMISLSIMMALLMASSGVWTRFINIDRSVICIALCYLVIFVVADYGNYLLQASGKMKGYAAAAIAERVVYLLLLYICSIGLFASSPILAVLSMMAAAKLAQVVLQVSLFDRGLLVPPVVDKKTLIEIVKYSLPVLLFFPAAYISEWGDMWVIKFFLPVASVGVYQLAYQGLLSLTQLYMVITVLLFPLMTSLRSQGKDSLVADFLKTTAPQIVFVWSLVIAVLIAVGDHGFALVFGNNYASGKDAFIILLSAVVFIGISGIYSSVAASYDLVKYIMFYSAFTAVFNIVGDVILVPAFGLKGASWATLAAYGLCATLYMRVGNKRLGVKSSASLLSALPALIVLAVSLMVGNIFVRLVLVAGVLFLSVLVVRRLGLFNRRDLWVLERIATPEIFEKAVRHLYMWLERPAEEDIALEEEYEKKVS